MVRAQAVGLRLCGVERRESFRLESAEICLPLRCRGRDLLGLQEHLQAAEAEECLPLAEQPWAVVRLAVRAEIRVAGAMALQQQARSRPAIQ